MRVITDLHIHSRFSRACSKELNLQNIARWCEIKGIDVVGTADFTFPKWFEEIKEELEETDDGVFSLRGNKSKTKFVLTTEISSIYKQGDKVRRIHLCIFLSSIKSVSRLIKLFEDRGANLKSDGRPILGIPAPEITKIVLESDPLGLVIPAHAWTPWFSVFGSKSGFDSIEECFGDMSENIYAIETGLSSDPPMNWRLSSLDKYFLISNSDAHSLKNLGREANVFAVDNFDYKILYSILKTHDQGKFLYTIEFFPEEGMYHYDGHRICNLSSAPEETKKNGNVCPNCKKPMTLGVLHRVAMLADRKLGFTPTGSVPYKNIVPLEIIIGEAIDKNRGTKSVDVIYQKLIKNLGDEFKILLDLSYEKIGEVAPKEVVEAIRRVREGKLIIEPGYDGVYGTVKIFSPAERIKQKQTSML